MARARWGYRRVERLIGELEAADLLPRRQPAADHRHDLVEGYLSVLSRIQPTGHLDGSLE